MFLEHLSFNNCLKWTILPKINSGVTYNKNELLFSHYLPVKLHKSLLNFKSLKILNTVRFSSFEKLFQALLYKYKLKVYCKCLYFLRYVDHFLIGIVGSTKFLNQIKLRIINFTRSNLHVSLRDFNSTFYNEPCIFLGFKILMSLVSVKKDFSFSSYSIKKKYEKRIFSRLKAIKSKLSYIYVKRFNSEMLNYFNLLLENKSKKNFSNLDKKILTYLFQLEAIRSAQFGHLIFSTDGNNFFSENFFASIRSSKFKFLNYKLYSFDIFIKKMQTMLQNLVLETSIFLPKSVLPLDIFFSKLNREYTKKAIIFLETFSFSKEDVNEITNPLENSIFFLGSNNLKQEIKTIKLNLSFVKQKSYYKTKFSKLLLLIPFDFLIKKLSHLGFIHPFKKRPVGNTKYILLDDKSIIVNFGYFANVLLFWYRCCDNIKKIKIVIDILKQSCFLTLCRKHNKNKVWAMRIYTSDLVFFRNSFYKQSFFPSNSYIKTINKKFLLIKSFYSIFFNETLLLT